MKKILLILLLPILAFSQSGQPWVFNPSQNSYTLFGVNSKPTHEMIKIVDSTNTSAGAIKFNQGTVIFNALKGSGGNKMLVADDNGTVTKQAIPSGGGTYTGMQGINLNSNVFTIDTLKVPYYYAGRQAGYLKFNGIKWIVDNRTFITGISGTDVTSALGYTPLAGNQSITVTTSGDASGSGTGSTNISIPITVNTINGITKNYFDVTGPIQGQLNGKQATITTGFGLYISPGNQIRIGGSSLVGVGDRVLVTSPTGVVTTKPMPSDSVTILTKSPIYIDTAGYARFHELDRSATVIPDASRSNLKKSMNYTYVANGTYGFENRQAGNDSNIVSSVINGKNAVRFLLNRNQTLTRERSELLCLNTVDTLKFKGSDRIRWVGTSIFIPNDFKSDNYNQTISPIVAQFLPSAPAPRAGRSPNIYLAIANNRWLLGINSNLDSTANTNTGNTNLQYDLGAVNLGKFTNFVLNIKWSSGPVADGYVNIWKDGKQVTSLNNIATCYNDPFGFMPYFKFGIYNARFLSLGSNEVSVTNRIVVYHADTRYAFTAGSYNDVAPDKTFLSNNIAIKANLDADTVTVRSKLKITNTTGSNKLLGVNSLGETYLASGSSGGATAFIGLSDVPSSYASQSLKLLRVNSGETALEFFTPTYLTSSTGVLISDGTYVKSVILNTPNVLYSTPINFTTSGNTATGTLALNTQTPNKVFASDPAGSTTTPTFRSLVAADVPTLNQNTTGSAGTITGSITESQVTNLVTDLSGKQPLLSGTTSQYVLGDGSLATKITNNSQLINGSNYINLNSLSASLPLTYTPGTGQFAINTANTSTTGALTSTDWNTFNNKQSALSGTSSQYVLADGTYATKITNNNQLTNGAGYISNATGLISQGTNVTITGSGTSVSPYVINASAGTSKSAGYGLTDSSNFFNVNKVQLINTINNSAADGASATGLTVNTANTFSTAGSKLLSLKNNTVEQLSVLRGNGSSSPTWYFNYPVSGMWGGIYTNNGRFDIQTGTSNTYIHSNALFLDANTSIARSGDATSTATQKSSKSFSNELSLYNGSAGVITYAGVTAVASTTVNGDHRLGFFTGATSSSIATTGSEKMSVLSNGFVGIGTNAPSVSLDVNGSLRVRNFTSIGVVVNDATGLTSSIAPGTADNVLLSNGTNWTSTGLASKVQTIGDARYISLAGSETPSRSVLYFTGDVKIGKNTNQSLYFNNNTVYLQNNYTNGDPSLHNSSVILGLHAASLYAYDINTASGNSRTLDVISGTQFLFTGDIGKYAADYSASMNAVGARAIPDIGYNNAKYNQKAGVNIYTTSGNGSTTTISIAHGLTGITSSTPVTVTPNSTNASGYSYVTIDATNINVVYTIAPLSGTNNLTYSVAIKY